MVQHRRLYTYTYDHDFTSFAEGRVIPHAIYDLQLNTGFINLGISHDTSEFACDSLRQWWYTRGRYDYPQATSILILCDSGGSNSCRHYIFKQDLQQLADELGLKIREAHYLPYCSKYNSIEHRLFPHITRACQSVVFSRLDTVKELMARTKTKQGLSVIVNVIDKAYSTGRKATDHFMHNMPIIFDDFLPQWNYRAVAQC
ncbi:MAG: ISAzo13 family transposase [Anaerolineae bacterium]|nr:ISAzo13 family transposase [Anaerolineae bacterium]